MPVNKPKVRIKDSDNEYIYLFPDEKAMGDYKKDCIKFGLTYLGKNKYGDENNLVIKGTRSNLNKYANYLGYELHQDYLYKENQFAGDIIEDSVKKFKVGDSQFKNYTVKDDNPIYAIDYIKLVVRDLNNYFKENVAFAEFWEAEPEENRSKVKIFLYAPAKYSKNEVNDIINNIVSKYNLEYYREKYKTAGTVYHNKNDIKFVKGESSSGYSGSSEEDKEDKKHFSSINYDYNSVEFELYIPGVLKFSKNSNYQVINLLRVFRDSKNKKVKDSEISDLDDGKRKYNVSFNLNVWITFDDIYADDEDELREKLYSMTAEEIIENGYVEDSDMSDLDINEDEEYFRKSLYDEVEDFVFDYINAKDNRDKIFSKKFIYNLIISNYPKIEDEDAEEIAEIYGEE